ncbi:pyridoxamine 5'-phosphate oxidase family protein [Streptomyces sp. NPDC002573]|uniref:pyridoxamine 5'-phosphate oxidase family protein n=1 Tax=Streptomyces sp. NPDC002573 TaxID=3364651 RepID=UPI003689EBF1
MPYRLDAQDGNHTDEALRASLEELLADNTLFSLATTGPGGAHINTAFFAHDGELNLYFVSERSTQHSRNTASDPRAAATVTRQPPEYGEHLQGVQLSGVVHEARDTETGASAALACYQGRFPTFAQDTATQQRFLTGEGSLALYGFRVESLTLLDEPRFGRRVYIKAAVVR